MADGQKLPFAQQLNRTASRNAEDTNALNGKALPCSVTAVSNSIIEAQFEVQSGFTIPKVTVPHIGAEWIRYPTQINDKGMFISADASLNQTSGLGQGKADLIQPANLTPLVFVPIANANWTPTPNPNYLVMYGKSGVKIQSTVNAECSIELTSDGKIIFNGEMWNNGKRIDSTHVHDQVQSGSSNSGQVV